MKDEGFVMIKYDSPFMVRQAHHERSLRNYGKLQKKLPLILSLSKDGACLNLLFSPSFHYFYNCIFLLGR